MANLSTGTLQYAAAPAATTDRTRRLLLCGVVAGPLFFGVSLLLGLTRQGFSLVRHAISLLLLGDQGWMQTANFELTGLLAIAFAVGVRRLLQSGRAGTWGPRLIGSYGLGMIVAGLVAPDPSFGFPPGTPDGMPAAMSGHAMLHNGAFFVVMLSLVAACFVFRRRFAALGQRGWAIYCAATAAAAPAFIVLSAVLTPGGHGGVPLIGLGLTASGWIALVAAKLMAD